MSGDRERDRRASSEVKSTDSANEDSYPSGFSNWLRVNLRRLIPRRGQRLWKTRLVAEIVVLLLVFRVAHVQICYRLAVKGLRANGYVRYVHNSVPEERLQKWYHPDNPSRMWLYLQWYPRPTNSPFQKLSNKLSAMATQNRRNFLGKVYRFQRTAFHRLTKPFLMPVEVYFPGVAIRPHTPLDIIVLTPHSEIALVPKDRWLGHDWDRRFEPLQVGPDAIEFDVPTSPTTLQSPAGP